MTRVQSLDIPTVSHGGENDVLFAISDMIKDERRRLTTEVGETMETKFDQMDQRMNDSNLRPLKLSIKMETNIPENNFIMSTLITYKPNSSRPLIWAMR